MLLCEKLVDAIWRKSLKKLSDEIRNSLSFVCQVNKLLAISRECSLLSIKNTIWRLTIHLLKYCKCDKYFQSYELNRIRDYYHTNRFFIHFSIDIFNHFQQALIFLCYSFFFENISFFPIIFPTDNSFTKFFKQFLWNWIFDLPSDEYSQDNTSLLRGLL